MILEKTKIRKTQKSKRKNRETNLPKIGTKTVNGLFCGALALPGMSQVVRHSIEQIVFLVAQILDCFENLLQRFNVRLDFHHFFGVHFSVFSSMLL